MTHTVSLVKGDVRGQVTPSEDFTAFWRQDSPRRIWNIASPASSAAVQEPSRLIFTANERVTIDDGLSAEDENGARTCICSCWNRTQWCGTFRAQKAPRLERDWRSEPWVCSADVDQKKCLIQTRQLIEALRAAIGPQVYESPNGLVVISGATNSAKSSIAKAFGLAAIRRATEKIKENFDKAIGEGKDPKAERLPHLIALEDPIEDWSIGVLAREPLIANKVQIYGPLTALEFNFCFTAREVGGDKDVVSIQHGLQDARRQTPTCVFIGEVRNPEEWEHVLEFAGTGHLVVVTTHAASLNETIGRVLSAVKASDPVRRREVGGQLLACIHLRKTPSERPAVLPAIWTRHSSTLNGLVADGLSSVTPNEKYILSRRQFLDQYVVQDMLTDPASWENLREQARQVDIEELRQT